MTRSITSKAATVIQAKSFRYYQLTNISQPTSATANEQAFSQSKTAIAIRRNHYASNITQTEIAISNQSSIISQIYSPRISNSAFTRQYQSARESIKGYFSQLV